MHLQKQFSVDLVTTMPTLGSQNGLSIKVSRQLRLLNGSGGCYYFTRCIYTASHFAEEWIR